MPVSFEKKRRRAGFPERRHPQFAKLNAYRSCSSMSSALRNSSVPPSAFASVRNPTNMFECHANSQCLAGRNPSHSPAAFPRAFAAFLMYLMPFTRVILTLMPFCLQTFDNGFRTGVGAFFEVITNCLSASEHRELSFLPLLPLRIIRETRTISPTNATATS